ncbi:MAG: zinc ribbon domain-containing protein [Dethiobacteraceae bacterium]
MKGSESSSQRCCENSSSLAWVIDKFYPSARRCNRCYVSNQMLTLSDRKRQCSTCEAIHDRDRNAAKNILEEGLRLLVA